MNARHRTIENVHIPEPTACRLIRTDSKLSVWERRGPQLIPSSIGAGHLALNDHVGGQMNTAREWIETLGLQPHPEGGWFRETYRSAESVARAALPPRFSGDRAISTAIYYLLQGDEFSALHRIRQDEVFHFYDGRGLTLHVIDPRGVYTTIRLGRDRAADEVPQAVIPAGCVFGATVGEAGSFALVGCTVAPGFDFADFELPRRDDLCRQLPQHRAIIERLTRGGP